MKSASAVFIIGNARSGTKLLRSLLNNHPDISLGGEGNYIPTLIKRFGIDADVSQPPIWSDIFQEFSQSMFYGELAKRGKKLSEAAFIGALTTKTEQGVAVSWSDVFEVFLRFYRPHPQARIYGDKSHGYMNNIPMLRHLLKDARFIFIIRDPRDQALSALRTWGRNPLRTAQLWFDVCYKAEQFGFDTTPDVLTVRYEDLTAETERELKRICAFLHVPQEAAMAVLQRPAEKERDGRQLKGVVEQHAKYKEAFSTGMIEKISEITLPYLAKYGYPDEGATRHRKLGATKLKLLSYADGLASLRFHMKERGITKGFYYYVKRHYEARSNQRVKS
jgi:hypothetical protein